MRTLIIIALLFSTNIGNMWAQRPTSTITFYTTDAAVLQVSVNDRMFSTKSTQLTIGNIPGKRPYVEVFQIYNGNEGRSQMQRIFSGTLKIERGEQYIAEVSQQQRTIALMKGTLAKRLAPSHSSIDESVALEGISDEDASWMVNPLLEELVNEMNEYVADEDKLDAALNFKNKTWTVPNMVIIMEQLLFDESRLKFLKTQSVELLTPNQIEQLKEAFTSEEAKKTLDKLK